MPNSQVQPGAYYGGASYYGDGRPYRRRRHRRNGLLNGLFDIFVSRKRHRRRGGGWDRDWDSGSRGWDNGSGDYDSSYSDGW